MGNEHTLLGRTLERLRTRERLSRRELSTLSGISGPQIGEIEKGGKGRQPSPNTLRALAKGLAAIPPENTETDEHKLRAYYQALMADAGYLHGLPSTGDAEPNGSATPTDQDVLVYLEQEAEDRAFAEKLVRLAAAYRQADPTLRRHIDAVVGAVAGPEVA